MLNYFVLSISLKYLRISLFLTLVAWVCGSLFLSFQRWPLLPRHSGDSASHPSAPAKTQHLELVLDLGCPISLTFDFWTCFILPSWVLTSHWKETWKQLHSISLVFFQFPLNKPNTKNPKQNTPPPPPKFSPQTLGFGDCCTSYGQCDSFLILSFPQPSLHLIYIVLNWLCHLPWSW